jgi:hypothetical protein
MKSWPTAVPLKWLINEPIWVDWWPLLGQKLLQADILVQQQIKAGHVEPSNSPWNGPIFVKEKKAKGKYGLIHDLQAISKAMQTMGALQPGLPPPAMIPAEFTIIIIDLKDCLFTIQLHDNDKEKFAFTLPSINNEKLDQQYQWKVLP